MGKMYLMSGLSGAGKTTFAKKFAEEHSCVYLAIDDFYKKAGASYDAPNQVFGVWMEFFEEIHWHETQDHDIIIDTNSPTHVKRLQFIDWFPHFDSYNLILILADRELREKNNKSRSRVVPEDEMERMEVEFEMPGIVEDRARFLLLESRWDSARVFLNEDNKLKELEAMVDENF